MNTKARPPRSARRSDHSPPDDGPGSASGVGGAFLDLFPPPALCDDADTYLKVYSAVQEALEGTGTHHAHAAYHAAYDAASNHIERQLGGEGR